MKKSFKAGPWLGVLTTDDPGDDERDAFRFLQDAVNMMIPDPLRGSGAYSRPAAILMNPSGQLGGANHQGQGVFHHTAADKTEYNFEVVSGKLYRVSSDLTTYTDVTPVGPVIDGSLSTRGFMLTFADKLIVSDGVNRPWIGSNLSSTPITGTNIQYDVGNSAWCAQHMTEYSGALVFVLKTVGGVFAQSTIAWSAPNDPTSGYFNTVSGTAVDYTWIVTQTGSTPIYAIWGLNVALLYFRDDSIGALTGAIGPDFKNEATHDAVDFKIGTQSPASIAQHGNTIFFADTEGRPQMFSFGQPLNPIWLQMRSIVDASRTDVPQATAVTACSAVIANLNLWVVALWSPTPSIKLSPATLYVFDVKTGIYVGRWIIGPGVNIEAMGILKDQNGEPELVVIGTQVAAVANGFGGYVWRFANRQENLWLDSGVSVPNISAQTQKLGFTEDTTWNADRAGAITGNASPVQIQILTPSMNAINQLVEPWVTLSGEAWVTLANEPWMVTNGGSATATPSASLDGTYRCVWGVEAMGREFMCTLLPTTASSQWRLDRVQLDCIGAIADAWDA